MFFFGEVVLGLAWYLLGKVMVFLSFGKILVRDIEEKTERGDLLWLRY